MSVRKAIFPGLIFGIICLVGFTNLLLLKSTNRRVVAQTGAPAAEQSNQSMASVNNQTVQNFNCTISSTYPDSVRQWCHLIEQYAQENGLDPNLVSAVMLNESAGKPDAYSKSGAVGLMQVMPRDGKASTFQCKNGPCFANRPSMEELFDPEYNVAYGAQMLAELIQHYGDVREALRAYGPMDVGYYYADLILGTMNTHQ